MRLCRCPICHSDIHLEALIEDEAGRELLGKITQLTHGCAQPMVGYLGLFKPAKSSLNNARALKILSDVLALYPCSQLLAQALSETVASLRKKRQQALENGQRVEPLTNHNYLKSVYDTHRPMFAQVKSDKQADNEQTKTERLAEQKKRDAILYVEQYINLGRRDLVENQPQYQVWLAHQDALAKLKK
ncbi:hypothetical protein A4G20_05560 [Pasteurellaceae bacterium RH1A]|nr:hypothetical protein A4G20_05560 [Pasteurellaceae bacterium RH1A]